MMHNFLVPSLSEGRNLSAADYFRFAKNLINYYQHLRRERQPDVQGVHCYIV